MHRSRQRLGTIFAPILADDNRKSLEVLDLCPQLVAMLANLMRQHISARDHAGFVASDVVHSAVHLLKLLCVAGNILRVLYL